MKATNKKNNLLSVDALSVGGSISDSIVSLTLYAQDMQISKISELIGVSPDESHEKGDILRNKKPATTAMWSLNSPGDLAFIDKIKYLLSKTTDSIEAWNTISDFCDMQLRCVIFMHAWNEGFDIPLEVLRDLSQRNWKFGLSVYSAEGDDIVSSFLNK